MWVYCVGSFQLFFCVCADPREQSLYNRTRDWFGVCLPRCVWYICSWRTSSLLLGFSIVPTVKFSKRESFRLPVSGMTPVVVESSFPLCIVGEIKASAEYCWRCYWCLLNVGVVSTEGHPLAIFSCWMDSSNRNIWACKELRGKYNVEKKKVCVFKGLVMLEAYFFSRFLFDNLKSSTFCLLPLPIFPQSFLQKWWGMDF